MLELEWRVQHPHPDNVKLIQDEGVWFERESLEQAQNYAKAGFKVQSREVTEWKEDDPNA